jgi:hypothetical protein
MTSTLRALIQPIAVQRQPLGRAAGVAAVSVAGPDQGPAGMGLTADIGLGSVILAQQIQFALREQDA